MKYKQLIKIFFCILWDTSILLFLENQSLLNFHILKIFGTEKHGLLKKVLLRYLLFYMTENYPKL